MSKRLNDRQRYSATEVALTLRLAKRDCDDEPTMFLQLKSHKVYDLKAYLQFKDWPATGHKAVLITRIINLHGSPCHTISDSVLFQASDSESAPVPKRLKRWHSDLELESQSKPGEPLSHTGCSCALCECVSKSLKVRAMRLQVTQGKRGAFPWPGHPGHTTGEPCFWEHTMRKCLTPFGNTIQGGDLDRLRNTPSCPVPERVVDRFSCTWWHAALWADEASADGRWPAFDKDFEKEEKMQETQCVDQLNDELSQLLHQASMEIAHASSINSRNYRAFYGEGDSYELQQLSVTHAVRTLTKTAVLLESARRCFIARQYGPLRSLLEDQAQDPWVSPTEIVGFKV